MSTNDQVLYELNILEDRAAELLEEGRVRDALRIYIFMADGDPSLDGGHLAALSGIATNVSANRT